MQIHPLGESLITDTDQQLAKWIQVGASPRGAIALDICSRARAWLNGQDHVTPDNVRSVVHDCLRHRIILSYEANVGAGAARTGGSSTR